MANSNGNNNTNNNSNDPSILDRTKNIAKNDVAGGIVSSGLYFGAHALAGFLIAGPAGAVAGVKIAAANAANVVISGTIGSAV